VTTTVTRRALDWLLCDRRTGRRTVVQRPNLPLILFVVLRLVTIPLSGTAADVLRWVGSAVLAWWAVDEIVRGVNPFRRLLGGVVLAVMVYGTVTALR
jgi:hypothetical protein